jgi:hypothetical protein
VQRGILVPWYTVHQTMRLHPECQIIKRRPITQKKDSGSSILCNSFKHKIAFVHRGSGNTQEWMCMKIISTTCCNNANEPQVLTLIWLYSILDVLSWSEGLERNWNWDASGQMLLLLTHCTLDAACFKSISKFIVRMQHRCSRWQQTFDQKSQTQI